jgi:hypothetical protein
MTLEDLEHISRESLFELAAESDDIKILNLLLTYYKDREYEDHVYFRLACNKNTPPHILEVLSNVKNTTILFKVSKHLNISDATLEKLSKSDDENIKRNALNQIANRIFEDTIINDYLKQYDHI